LTANTGWSAPPDRPENGDASVMFSGVVELGDGEAVEADTLGDAELLVASSAESSPPPHAARANTNATPPTAATI